MEKLTKIAELLGEKNEQRLKDGITDAIIDRVVDDLRDYDMYLLDYDAMFSEIQKEVASVVKDKVLKLYMEQADKKLDQLLVGHLA